MAAAIPMPKANSRFRPDNAATLIKFADGDKEAVRQLTAQGIPNTSLERWKFSNLPAALKKLALTPKTAAITFTGAFDFLGVETATYAPEQVPGLGMLVSAFTTERQVLDIPAKKSLSTPILMDLQGQQGALIAHDMVLRVGDGADVTLIETQTGQGEYWKNLGLTVVVGKNARLRHIRLVEDDPFSVLTQNTHVTIGRDGTYDSFSLTTGGAFTRHEVHAVLQGENAHVSLNGLSLMRGKQHTDTTLTIEHQAPHCQSNQFFKTVLGDQSRGVFQGKIHVHQIAQKTDGYQLSNNLLLSPMAEMNVKPELEIYADDVKCSHGTTTGQLDETPLFYLRSRGIPEQQARALLIEAFLGEVVDKITVDETRARIAEKVAQWLI